MMKCIVVDDEKLARDLMKDNISRVPFLQFVRTCRNAVDAAGVLHAEPIDLMFLDVQMPGLNGLDFVRTLPSPPMIILVSAYDRYALDGFDLSVVDYLVKPVAFERFLAACNKSYELFTLKQTAAAKPTSTENGYFFVNVEYSVVKVNVNDILFVEGMKDYVRIHVASTPKPVMTRMSMKAIGEKLAPHDFVRIHKSFLVSVRKISSVKRDLLSIGSKELPVGDTYRENVSRILKKK